MVFMDRWLVSYFSLKQDHSDTEHIFLCRTSRSLLNLHVHVGSTLHKNISNSLSRLEKTGLTW